jgi:hypothetical protein
LSTPSPCAGSSSTNLPMLCVQVLGTSRRSSLTTSTMPRVRVPRHVLRLVVDYFTSRRLVIDYFAYAARLGASAHRVACHVARR